MNYRVIAIFTFYLLTSGILIGVASGFWIAQDESIGNSPLVNLGQHALSFIAGIFIFYFLFKRKLSMPILHAVVVWSSSQAIAFALYYTLSGLFISLSLFVTNVIMSLVVVALSFRIAKGRGYV